MKTTKFEAAQHLLAGERPIALITTFQLRDDAQPDQFLHLWTEVARLMEQRPGFISCRMYRARGRTQEHIMVAHWTCARLLATARADPEVRSADRSMLALLVGVRRVLCDPTTEILPHAWPSSRWLDNKSDNRSVGPSQTATAQSATQSF